MKRKTEFQFGGIWKRLLAVLVAVNLIVPVGAVSAAESGTVGTVSTGYTVEINETVSNGFTHPGVGVTKATLKT